MLIYRLSIWSHRGRIERDVERDRDDILESIHAAGIIATALQSGDTVRAAVSTGPARRRPAVRIASETSQSLVRDARAHLKEAWLLLSNAGAQEAVAHVREGLRRARLPNAS